MLRAPATPRLCVLGSLCALITIAASPVVLRSFAEGPFPGFTGGFKEPTCAECHAGNDLNAPGGRLSLSGVPATYQPGEGYTLTVLLAKEGLERGGFQLSARAAAGAGAGRDAGELVAAGADLQLVKSGDSKVTYVQHTPSGTRAAKPGALKWTFRWVAPRHGVPVRFDVAANASNNDEMPSDDFIYTTNTVTRPGRQGEQKPSRSRPNHQAHKGHEGEH